ncbi:helix-turn-helix domain-containing protein [Cytobacillus horneckiae]|uniref:helix-turn-helix domain-containing protein n=1 Tax=Cytobacillus horneckiae TaxID=549687 RepID=UPI0019D1B297|nr:helix-turn-helix transcriptional regulator [Cytobacillus horneckiae]
MLSERLRELRKKHKLTQKDLGDFLGISESGYGYYEQGRNEPSLETLKKLALKYDVSMSYLSGDDDKEFNEREEKDIAKQMEKIRKDLESQDGLSFYGEPLSEEALESLMESMEYVVKQTKKINRKYIPKKYRDK